MSEWFRGDDRGVSATVNYIQVIVIATLLISGLIFVGSELVLDQHDQATNEGLTIVGMQLAAELEATDVLVHSTNGNGTIERTVDLPTVSAGSYTVEVTGSGPAYDLTLTTTDSGHSVTVPFVSDTPVDATRVQGEQLRITYTPGGSLEVRDE